MYTYQYKYEGVQLGSNLNYKWYGVEWDVTNSSPLVTRIADSVSSLSLHSSLPIQSQMKGCLLKDDGTVNYYLNATDWTKKADGTASNLDGTDGQVMVEIPEFYWMFETSGNTRRVKLSTYAISGFTKVKKMYVGAYEAALQRSTNKLASVVNLSTDYRGGNNNAAWDAQSNSLLGTPATSISRTSYRTYARSRGTGWEMYFYLAHKVLFWLFIVEFATRDSQAPVSSVLTTDGYKQGGLGDGVTTTNSTEWNNFNSYYPFIKCGASNSLASGTGEVSVNIPDFGGAGITRTFKVSRYRGIENPFGHLWKNCDGINIKIQADSAGGESQVWTSDDPAIWNDSGYTGYTNKGLLLRIDGWVSQTLFGSGGEFVPKVVSGGSTTYYCDYSYTLIPASGEGLRTLLLGGRANSGAGAGFGFSISFYAPSDVTAYFGSRLCFLGT